MWLAVPPLFLLLFPPCPVPVANWELCWTNLFCYKVSDWLVTCDWPYLLYSYWCFLPVMFQQLTQRSVGPTYFVTRYLIGYLYEAMWLALPPLFLLVFSSLSCSSSRLSALLLQWLILLRGIWLVTYTKWCDWPYLLYSYWSFLPCPVPAADSALCWTGLFCYEVSDWLVIPSDVIGRTSSIPIGVSSLSCSSSRLSALLDWIILLRGIWLVTFTYLLYSYRSFLPVLLQ